MRGAPRYRYIGFEKSPSLSSVAAPRRRSTGASGGSLFLYSGTDAQGAWLVGPGPHVKDWVVASNGDGEAHYHGRRFACRVVVRLLHTRRPAHQLYDLWAWAPVSEAGLPWCELGEMVMSGRVFLEKGFTLRVAVTLSHSLQLLCPFASEPSAPHSCSSTFCRRSHHGLAVSSRAVPD